MPYANQQKRIEYAQNYKLKHPQAFKEWYAKNKDNDLENTYKWRNLNHDWYLTAKRARSKVDYLIKKGKLVRPKLCSKCFKKGRIEAHHHDYSKPLEIQWLCRHCHYFADLTTKSMTPTSKIKKLRTKG